MIIMLFIFALAAVFSGFLFFRKKKSLVGWMFMLLAVFLSVVGIVTILLYPHIWPF